MKVHTTVKSPGAIVLAFLFFCVTCFVLFQDVLHKGISVIGTDHVLTLAVLLGTVAAGHFFWTEARQWRLGAAFGLACLFCVGTCFCILNSGGRNAVQSIEKGMGAHKDNDDRARLTKDLDEAKVRLEEANKAEQAECASGAGPRCSAQRQTRTERQTYANVLAEQLKLAKPEQPENADIKYMAKAIAELPWVTSTPERIEEKLNLFLPIFKATFAEVATIVFSSIGIGHKVVRSPIAPVESDSAQTDFTWPVEGSRSNGSGRGGNPMPTPPKRPNPEAPKGPKCRMTRSEVLSDLMLRSATGRRFRSQDEAAKHYGMSPSRFSEWLKEWETEGSVPQRRMIGRCKVLAD